MSRKVKRFITGLSIFLLLATVYLLYVLEHGNFHEITADEAYRSGQLDSSRLAYYIKKHNIKSVLNLRGNVASDGHSVAHWYLDEKRVSTDLGAKHYDIYLSSSSRPDNEAVMKLMDFFKSAPRPVLIHCKSGADRAGLVASMWKVVVDKEPKSEAENQLSLQYGHFPFGGAAAMDRFFDGWQPDGDLKGKKE